VNLQTGYFEFANPSCEAIFGYTVDELLAMKVEGILSLIHPDDFEMATFDLERLDRDGGGVVEFRVRIKNGDYRWQSWNTSIVRDASGHPLYRDIAARDVTVHKQIEERLRGRESFFSRMTDVMPNVLHVFDVITSSPIFINRNVASMLGFSAEEVVAMGSEVLPRLMHPDDLPRFEQQRARILALYDDDVAVFEFRMRKRVGGWRWFQSRNAVFTRDASGRPRQLIGTATDITERKSAEETLKEKDRMLADSQAIAHIGSWVVNIKADRVLWSDEGLRIFGFSPETNPDVSFERFLSMLHPDDRHAMQAWSEACLAARSPPGIEFRALRLDGTVRWLLGCGRLETDASGAPSRMVGTVQDITERRLAEEKLRESENRLLPLSDSGLLGVIYWNTKGEITDANDKFLELVGYSRDNLLHGHIDWARMTPPEYRDLDERSLGPRPINWLA